MNPSSSSISSSESASPSLSSSSMNEKISLNAFFSLGLPELFGATCYYYCNYSLE